MKGSFGRLMVVALATLALSACDRSPRAGAAPKPPESRWCRWGQQTVPLYGQYVGQTEAVKTVEVRARVEGSSCGRSRPTARTVKAGDVLFVIDPGRSRRR
jgi:multidrug efflux pump subunit AcrA (membrane-fusion protein)